MDKERFQQLEKEKLEREELSKFLENAERNELLNKHKIKFVNSNTHTFFKFISIIFLILLSIFLILVGKIAYDGKLQSTYENIINPLFNATINNNISFNPKIENEYKNNFTIINNIIIQNVTQ